MNNCPKQKNLWNELGYMIMGIALFELTSKLINNLEAQAYYGHRNYVTPLYIFLLCLTTLGLMIAINYALSLYVEAQKSVKQGLR